MTTNFQYTNNAYATFSVAVTELTTTFVLSGKFNLLPATNGKLTCIKRSWGVIVGREIVFYTNRTTNTLTGITRAYEACPVDDSATVHTQVALAFDAGDTLELLQTAKDMENILDGLPRNVQNQTATYALSTGAVNTYAVTLSPVPTAYVTGMQVQFKANLANTATATVNVNGLGAKTIKKLGGGSVLTSGDIALNSIVSCIYNGTDFEMQTPIANFPTVDITGQTEIVPMAQNDEFVIYNQTAGLNRKVKLRGTQKFWGIASDGVVDWTADITLTGSNNTIIERNYASWNAGTAPRTFTVTPTGCILYIRIKWDASFTNWTFNLNSKWCLGGVAQASTSANGSNGASSVFFINGWGGAGGVGGNSWGGGASALTSGAGGSSGAGGVTSWRSANNFQLLKTSDIDCGAGGGSGGTGSWSPSGAGGIWGGCIIIEVGGNLTLTTSTINANGSAGGTGAGASGGGGGGGGGGILIVYGWTLTWSATTSVLWGAGGGGLTTWGAGGVGIYRIYKNNYLT